MGVHQRPAPAQASGQHRIPKIRALPPPQRLRKYRIPLKTYKDRGKRDSRKGDRNAQDGCAFGL